MGDISQIKSAEFTCDDEAAEDTLDKNMMAVFYKKINDLLLGKYSSPNMVQKCVNDITNAWMEMINSVTKDYRDYE